MESFPPLFLDLQPLLGFLDLQLGPEEKERRHDFSSTCLLIM